jgi:hypothetical protein
MSVIYLDPTAGSPNVIQIGDSCYMLQGPTSVAPTTSSFDDSFSDCTACTQCEPAICSDFGITSPSFTVTYTPAGSSSPQSLELTGDPDECEWSGVGYPGGYPVTVNLTAIDGMCARFQVVFDGLGTGGFSIQVDWTRSPTGPYPDIPGCATDISVG